MKNLLARFALVYKLWVPLLFVGFALAILQTQLFVPFLGETLMERIVKNAGDNLLAGWPVFWLLSIVLIALALSYFSNRLFQLEMKSIYGDLIKHLDDLLVDLEQLR